MTDNPWETPRHDRPLGHATPNPTPAYVPPPMTGFDTNWSAPSGSYGGGSGGSIGGGYAGPIGPRKKSLWLAIPLAVVLGPLGLFYLGLFHGLAAIVIVPWLARTVAFSAVVIMGGGQNTLGTVGVFTAWLICVPWAVIFTLRRNAKIDRS